MQRINKKQTLRGDTLVEVTFAIGIFAMVAISASTLMNNMLGKSQSAIEVVMARSEIDAQAEALRFIQSSTKNSTMRDVWTQIHTHLVYVSDENDIDSFFLTNVASCNEFTNNATIRNNAFYIDTFKLNSNQANEIYTSAATGRISEADTFPRVLHEISDDTILHDNFGEDASGQAQGIWVIAATGAHELDGGGDPEYYDFYIQTCWNSVGNSTPSTINTVVRLRNPDKTISHNPAAGGHGSLLPSSADFTVKITRSTGTTKTCTINVAASSQTIYNILDGASGCNTTDIAKTSDSIGKDYKKTYTWNNSACDSASSSVAPNGTLECEENETSTPIDYIPVLQFWASSGWFSHYWATQKAMSRTFAGSIINADSANKTIQFINYPGDSDGGYIVKDTKIKVLLYKKKDGCSAFTGTSDGDFDTYLSNCTNGLATELEGRAPSGLGSGCGSGNQIVTVTFSANSSSVNLSGLSCNCGG